MKLNPIVLFSLAGVLGLVAFLATQQHLSAKTEEERVAVLVAKTEIDVGDPVTEENSGMKRLPVSALPANPITKPEQWRGQFAGSRFLPGEVMLRGKVNAQFGAKSRQIPTGMMVQTINVDRTKSHAGLLTPGDRVDVWASFKVSVTDERTGRNRDVTRVKNVLGDLELWAVGDSVVGAEQGGANDRDAKKDTAKRDSSTVSLLVTPEQFGRLAGSEEIGTLFLGLRNPDDPTDFGDVMFDAQDLYEDGRDQRARSERNTAGVTAPAAPVKAAPVAAATSRPDPADDVAAFLDAEQAAPVVAPAEKRAEDVPTWTMTLHVGEEARPTEVVDVDAALAAGFTRGQIALKKRYLVDPNSAPAATADPLTGLAGPAGLADPAAAPLPPAAEQGPPADPAPAEDAADALPAPAADGPAQEGDGMFPMPS